MKHCLFFIFLLCHPLLFCQRGAVNYSRENGLVSNSVRDITFDKNGFLWIATDAGIDRFDGHRFIHFQHDPSDKLSIASDDIQIIEFDNRDHIWASTMNCGLIRIEINTLRVENFRNDPRDKRTPAEDRTTAIFTDSDNITWFSPHYKGLDRFDGKHFRNFRPSRQFRSLNARFCDLFMDIREDRHNKDILWCASLDGLFAFSKKAGKFTHYPVLKSSFFLHGALTDLESGMRCIEQDAKGNLYIGTWGGGMLYFDKHQEKYSSYLFESLKPVSGRRNNITDLKWRDGRYLYVSAAESGFLLFDTRKKEFIRYNEPERIIQNAISVARFGPQIAVASETKGIYIQNESIIYGKYVQLGFNLRRMAFSPDGREWLATSRGDKYEVMFRNVSGKHRIFPYSGVGTDREFGTLKPLHSTRFGWLVICSDRIQRFSEKKGLTDEVLFRNFIATDQLKNTVPISAYNENDSLIWMGTKYGGMLVYNFYSRKLCILRHSETNRNSPAHNSWIFTFASHDNILYYGYEEGLGAFDLKSRKFFEPVHNKVLKKMQVRALAFIGGNMWAGTEAEGIFVIDVKTGKVVRHFSGLDGLSSRQILRFATYNDDNLWARTSKGITFIHTKDFTLHSLSESNGIEGSNDIVVQGEYVYLPSSGGYIEALVSSHLPADSSPRPYIQRVRLLDGSPYQTGRTRFSYDENNIGFEFGVLDYSEATDLFLSYRLKGLEKNWHSGNNRDEAAYYNLPGGDYEFQVRCFENGKAYVTSYRLRIVPPFWTSWWFTILTVLLIGSATWVFMGSRITRIRKQESLRTEFNRQINEMESKALRAQMNPHFLFNSLNSIRLFILKNQVDDASDYITKFSRLLRMILNHSRLDTITVYDEIQTLKLYLDFERLRFDKGFQYDIRIDGQEVLAYQLPPMIIQPFVENAIWHGLMPRNDESSYVGISFSIQPGRLYVEVSDNGVGREQAKLNSRKNSLKEGSVGLEITKDRLNSLTKRTNRLNEYVIEDLYDQNGKPAGTLIKLYFETEEKS